MEDLGWLCVKAWRFGSRRTGRRLGDYEELFAAYTPRAATPSTPTRRLAGGARHLEVGRHVRARRRVLTSQRGCTQHELAAIGRRVCENEYDLFLAGRSLVRRWRTRTTLRRAELVEAVREWLERDVSSATDGRLRFHTRVA